MMKSPHTIPHDHGDLIEFKYTIIEAGPLHTRDLYTLDWTTVQMHEKPEMKELREILRQPWEGRPSERVAVNSFQGPADMFVRDGSAMPPVDPFNNLATAIYWSAGLMHNLARLDPPKTEADVQPLWVKAFTAAVELLESDDTTPRIHGRALLFDKQVWF